MAAAVAIPAWVSKHYDVLNELGRGAYGGVFKIRERSRWTKRRKAACKILDLDKEKEKSMDEAEIMRTLHGINGVLSLKKCHQDLACSCMVLELCECDLVTAMLTKFVPYDRTKLAEQFRHLAYTVRAMHKRGVVHRDIKPENVLVTKKKELKLADFGAAVHFRHGEKLHDVAGTWVYMAPEMVLEGNYDERVDIYALGLVLYFMLELETPFGGYDRLSPTFFRDRKLKFQQAPAGAIDLIQKMTESDPEKRITLDEVLHHPWLQNQVKGY